MPNLEKNYFKSYEKDVTYQKTPLVGRSLPLHPGSLLALPCQGLCSFIHSFFSVPALYALMIFFYFCKQRNNCRSHWFFKKSFFSTRPSSCIPTSLFPLSSNILNKQVTLLYTVCPLPPLLILPPVQFYSSHSSENVLVTLSVLVSPNVFRVSFLVWYHTLSWPVWYHTLFLALFLIYFSFSALPRSGTSPQNNLECLFISTCTPGWSLYCHHFDQYLMI